MTNKHPYADILQYLIDGGDYQKIQIKDDEENWISPSGVDHLLLLLDNTNYKFRIKPKTVMFNGLELPMYETEKLNYGAEYYVADSTHSLFYFVQDWINDSIDFEKLSRGLVFLKQEDAAAWGKAMCPKTS